ncbi:hypothetical protein H9W90_10015 [Polaribacter pectinis]|uniref:Bacteriophage abortive infection AbiH n=1 Tax=Polaribacter pectinis TaxID=2738844 RepID=A0A7G9L7B2_9FLAO|nr:AbiH family protein [Polaribacter pectinis]QNM84511.1 hypothetical protein H9W90_09915 [Polaribacter pectinis]QNM84531.1 hypothetical protein H9W90_10015 [Polaribacter pectinis]
MKTVVKSTNIILLIGNGFDLSHNLKTGYNDFATWLIEKIEKEIKTFITTKEATTFLKDIFFDFINREQYRYVIFQPDEIDNVVRRYFNNYTNDSLNELLTNNSDKIQTIISNTFLGKLYNNQYTNWFDIENAYFQELIRLKILYKSDSKYINQVKRLNKELIEIKNYLKEYLNTILLKHNPKINEFFNNIKVYDNLDFNIFIINFNYTKTIGNYFSEFSNGITNLKSVNINYIHGNLTQDNIVFGYGNDKHKEYQEIKDLEANEFLENFKTFAYLKNNNYNRIYSDILDNNSIDDYEVLVLGHSLGTTDKTLLEEVFNNEKCKKIRLFKRSDLNENEDKVKKSFDNLVFSASRILRNEKDLRKKILNYEDSDFFP